MWWTRCTVLVTTLLALIGVATGQGRPGCVCTMQYAPVCGTNGQTYSNSCVAACRGIGVAYNGDCGSSSRGGAGGGSGWPQQEQGPRPGRGPGSGSSSGWFGIPWFARPTASSSGGSGWGSWGRPNRLAAHQPAEVAAAAAAVAEQQAVPIQVQHKQQQQQLQHLENSDDKAKLTKQKEGAAGPSGDAGPAPGDAGSVGPPASWTLARKGDCGCPPAHEPVCVDGVTFTNACTTACGRRRAATAYSGPCVEQAGLSSRPASNAAGGLGSSRWRGSWPLVLLVLLVHIWQPLP